MPWWGWLVLVAGSAILVGYQELARRVAERFSERRRRIAAWGTGLGTLACIVLGAAQQIVWIVAPALVLYVSWRAILNSYPEDWEAARPWQPEKVPTESERHEATQRRLRELERGIRDLRRRRPPGPGEEPTQ